VWCAPSINTLTNVLPFSKIGIGGAYMNAEMTGETVILEMDRLLSNIACKYMPKLKPYVKNGKILVKVLIEGAHHTSH
jgi:hypothetical protein